MNKARNIVVFRLSRIHIIVFQHSFFFKENIIFIKYIICKFYVEERIDIPNCSENNKYIKEINIIVIIIIILTKFIDNNN